MFFVFSGGIRLSFRVGIGHDTHRIEPGGSLRIGGVDIDYGWHLVGHSDADVLLHAVTDAILGACGCSDIGELFPNTAQENKNRDSSEFVSAAMGRAADQGFQVANLDCIVFAEKPKLSSYKAKISQRIAELLSVDAGNVNVKAKTGEAVGPIGRCEAIVAECVVLLEKSAID